jgi:TPR repeat protein
MRFIAIALVAAVALLSAFLLAPVHYYVAERHALAQKAMSLGMPSVAAALLSPLVQMSDARALNNLAVLRARGAGVERNPAEARRLFARAAEQGSARARLNAVMMEHGGCGLNIDRAAATAVALGPIAETDPTAANLVHDCLYFDATSRPLPDRSDRALAAESAPPQPRDANALLHAGWAMMNLARTTTIPDYSDEEATRRYEEKVVPIARKAMQLLFAATEAGATAAYEGLGILMMQFGDKLGDDPMAVRLRERDNWEWLEVGAEKGDWAAQCRVADARITSMRYDGKPYTRDEFNAVVAYARQCIDRKEVRNDPVWFDQAEWLVVTPRYYLQSRPTLEIEATAGALNGLLFFDADRNVNAAEAPR